MKLKINLANNFSLKLLSLVIAVIIWMVIANVSDAETTIRYTCPVTLVNTDIVTENGKVFRVEEGESVRVTVRARQSVIRELKQSDFILTADMEKNLKYDKMVGITVECLNKNIVVDDDVTLSRSNVLVSIEDSASEQFPVTVNHYGTVGEGLMVGSLVPEQTIIKISGPASIVERIEKVEAQVDVTGLPGTTVKTCYLTLYNSSGDKIDNTYLTYVGKSDGIDVTVTMLKAKKVPLVFTYSGTPEENYKVSDIDWKPEIIEIAGSNEVLSALTSLRIPAEAVNVDGISEELQLVVDISQYLPSGVVLKDEEVATVLVIVEVEYVEPGEESDVTAEEDTGTSEDNSSNSGSSNSGSSNSGSSNSESSNTGSSNGGENANSGQDNSSENSGIQGGNAVEDDTLTDTENDASQETESGSGEKESIDR